MIHCQDIVADVQTSGIAKYFRCMVIQTLLDRGYVPIKSLIRPARG